MEIEDLDLFQEKDEYNENSKKIGKNSYKTLKLTFSTIEQTQTQMILGDETKRIGESDESTIIPEFWNYYSQFSSENLPSPENYYGETLAELKITILLREFHNYYLERVCPPSFPVPIIQKAYKKKPAKLFLIGDTHGSFVDTITMIPFFINEIEMGAKNNYQVKIIFLGDYIDRGKLDIHNLLYIMTFNLKYPNNVLLLRGNHEELTISANYGFGNRVTKYFSRILFAGFNYMFKDLPLIAIYHFNEGSIMCLHGGIPIISEGDDESYRIPKLITHKFKNREVWIDNIDDISQQILWNDPIIKDIPQNSVKYFKNPRGIGFRFGEEIFDKFCETNEISLIFRGHQVFKEGIKKNFRQRFITIFSASEYVGKNIEAKFVELHSNDIFNFKMHTITKINSF